MRIRVAVEFELETKPNKAIEEHISEFVDELARALIKDGDDECGNNISISYLDHDWTVDMPLLAKDAL